MLFAERAGAIFDLHGRALRAVAETFTADPEQADNLVIETIAAQCAGRCTLRGLAAGVHGAWSTLVSPPPSPRLTLLGQSALDDIRALPREQRAVLGLCRFGGHTWRQAGMVTRIPPGEVVHLLRQALLSLDPPGPIRALPSPAT